MWKSVNEPPEEGSKVALLCKDNLAGETFFSTGIYYKGKFHNNWSLDLIAQYYIVLPEEPNEGELDGRN